MRRLALAALLPLAALAIPPAARAADTAAADAAKSYRIVTDGSTQAVKAGGKGKLVLFIEPVARVHVHPQAPLKITLESSEGLKLEKATLGHADAADPKAEAPRFEVPFLAAAAGKQQARAKLDFFICSDQWCVKQVRDVVVPVEVTR